MIRVLLGLAILLTLTISLPADDLVTAPPVSL